MANRVEGRLLISRMVFLVLWLTALAITTSAEASSMHKYVLYVGTNTNKGSKGIYAYTFTPANGRLAPLGLEAEVASPTFLVVAANHQFLYTVSEIGNYRGRHSGELLAYRADPKTGQLTLLNEVASIGEGPCYLSLDKTGKFLLVANYDSGSVASFPVFPDGRLGEVAGLVQHLGASVNQDRQKGPHPHFIQTTADNQFPIAADLGLDQLLVYKFDSDRGSLRAATPPFAKVQPGAGPRHFVFHPNQKYVYVVNELDSTVSMFSYDHGTLQPKQTLSALPKDFKEHSDAAEIQIDAKGRFLYASNRGADTIAVFKINPEDGTLALIQSMPSSGKTPGHFAIDPTGKFMLVANRESDNIVTFRISKNSGKLSKTGIVTSATTPMCFAFIEAE